MSLLDTKEVMLKVKFKLDSSESRSDRASPANSREQGPQIDTKASKHLSLNKATGNGQVQPLFHVRKPSAEQ
jgi:hypothetical protein